MVMLYFFVCVHSAFVRFQEGLLSATASMTAHRCSSLAQSARPASPVHMRGIADAVVWRLQRSAKRRSPDRGITLWLQKPAQS
jgi:hypothetical protein